MYCASTTLAALNFKKQKCQVLLLLANTNIPPESRLSADIQSLFLSKHLVDFKIEVFHFHIWLDGSLADSSIFQLQDGNSVQVHKCILAARSAFFKALLASGFRESDKSEVLLKVHSFKKRLMQSDCAGRRRINTIWNILQVDRVHVFWDDSFFQNWRLFGRACKGILFWCLLSWALQILRQCLDRQAKCIL